MTYLVHWDLTPCHHDGPPQATITDKGGPRCAAGQTITHVMIGGHLSTVEEAAAAVKNLGDVITAMFTDLIALVIRLVAELGAALEPQMRVLAAAAVAWENERDAELGEDGGIPWKDVYRSQYERTDDDE